MVRIEIAILAIIVIIGIVLVIIIIVILKFKELARRTGMTNWDSSLHALNHYLGFRACIP